MYGNTSNFKYNDKLYDVVLIRSFAIILVVAFHAYYMMMVPAHFPDSMNVYRDLYYNINCLILKFRMPLYIFISGYLFSHLENERGKYKTFKNLLFNKFKRLILPYFVFSTLMMLTTHDFHMSAYWQLSYSHLWFVTMLFWCFIFTRLLSFLPWRNNLIWKLLISIVFFILCIQGHLFKPFLNLHNFLPSYFWFWTGYNLYLNREKIYSFMKSNSVFIISLLVMIYIVGVFYRCRVLIDDDKTTFLTEFANLSIILVIWFITNFIINKSKSDWVKSPILANLNKYSYGIYIFHNWIQPYMISTTAKRIFNLEQLAANHVVLFPLMFFITSFFISMFITHLCLKTKVGRYLIG